MNANFQFLTDIAQQKWQWKESGEDSFVEQSVPPNTFFKTILKKILNFKNFEIPSSFSMVSRNSVL